MPAFRVLSGEPDRTKAAGIVETVRVPTRSSSVVPQLVEIKPAHFAACIRISPDQPHIENVPPGAAPGIDSGIKESAAE